MLGRFRYKSIAAAALCIALVTSACTELGEPDLGAAPGEAPVQVVAIDDAPATAEGSISADSTLPQFMPERPEGYIPELLVASPGGTGILAGPTIAALNSPVTELASRKVFDDFFGGVVVEDEEGRVLWLAEQADAGIVINGDGGSLLDVGFIDGSSWALLATSPSSIERYGFVSGERVELVNLAGTESVLDVSSGGGLYVLAIANEECGEIRFLNSAGAPVTLPGAPQVSDCPVLKQPIFTHVATAPSGDIYAYTEVTYRSDGVAELTEVVIAETSTGFPFRIPIGGAGETITSLSIDGPRIAFVRESTRPTEIVVIDIAKPDSPSVSPFEAVASVSFARIPLRVGAANG